MKNKEEKLKQLKHLMVSYLDYLMKSSALSVKEH